jgi:iron complex transport system substrate-binding protein
MRIISLVPSVTETLFELGLEDQITAVTRWCNRPADKVLHKPKVGGTKNPKLDSVVELNPDIVILDCDENRKQDAEELERRGIRTFTVFPKTIEDSIDLIRDLGKMFSVQQQAKIMIEEIKERLEKHRTVRIYDSLILIWRAPYMTINSDTYVHSASSLFGFRNVFADHQQRYPSISPGDIEQINPNVVLFPDEPYPFKQKHLVNFKKEFPDLSATRKNHMLLFDGSYIAWHGFGTLRALREFPSLIASQLS